MFGLNKLLPGKCKSTTSTSNSTDSRKRFRISTAQGEELEKVFKENPRPCKEIQEEISVKIDLPYRTVTIWFQNRRAKAKLSGEQIADHVYQWKPPMTTDKKSTLPATIMITQPIKKEKETSDLTDQLQRTTLLEDNTQCNTMSNDQASQGVKNAPEFSNGMINSAQNWAPQYYGNDWSSTHSVGKNSIDSGSFISDYSNYDGLSGHQMEFDNYLNNQAQFPSQMPFGANTMMPPGFDGNAQYPIQAMYTPPLSNSVLTLSSQNSGPNGYDRMGPQFNNNQFYQSSSASAQSLPHFMNSVNHHPSLNPNFNLQHSIQSAPELALQQQRRALQMAAPNVTQARAQAKLQKLKNDAMFFSMRS